MSTSCLFYCFLFSFNDAAPTEIYTLSLHDALPIFSVDSFPVGLSIGMSGVQTMIALFLFGIVSTLMTDRKSTRLNSSHVAISYAVFCLKKKKKKIDPFVTDRHNTHKRSIYTLK